MQAERDYGTVPHRLVQEFPAPLCASCNVPMWVIKREGDVRRRFNRFGYNCRVCGETRRARHDRHSAAAAQ